MSEASLITLYTADTPNGQKISIFLKEAGIGYEVVKLNLSEGRQHSPQFLAINPNGKIPAIVDHQAGISVFESAAIKGNSPTTSSAKLSHPKIAMIADSNSDPTSSSN